jgi:hypothetical protein
MANTWATIENTPSSNIIFHPNASFVWYPKMTFGYTYLSYAPTHILSIIIHIDIKDVRVALIVMYLSIRSARNTMSTKGPPE